MSSYYALWVSKSSNFYVTVSAAKKTKVDTKDLVRKCWRLKQRQNILLPFRDTDKAKRDGG